MGVVDSCVPISEVLSTELDSSYLAARGRQIGASLGEGICVKASTV